MCAQNSKYATKISLGKQQRGYIWLIARFYVASTLWCRQFLGNVARMVTVRIREEGKGVGPVAVGLVTNGVEGQGVDGQV